MAWTLLTGVTPRLFTTTRTLHSGTGGKVSQVGIFCDLLSVFPHSAGIYIKSTPKGSFDQSLASSARREHRRTYGKSTHSLRTFDTPGCVGSISGFPGCAKQFIIPHIFLKCKHFSAAHTRFRGYNKATNQLLLRFSQQKPMLRVQLYPRFNSAVVAKQIADPTGSAYQEAFLTPGI